MSPSPRSAPTMSALRTSSHSVRRATPMPGTVAALANLPDRSQQLRANFVKRFPTVDAWQHRTPRALTSSYCTVPTAPALRSSRCSGTRSTAERSPVTTRTWLRPSSHAARRPARFRRIVFTTYPQPLPSAGQSDDCLEVGDLARDELDYLSTLENTLKATLTSAAGGLPGVSIADISGDMKGHEYCTSDPWSYGLSVLLHNDDSLAPFHPTPNGQAPSRRS